LRGMARGLVVVGVAGVRTAIPFRLGVMARPDFVAGRLSTAFVERLGGGAVASPAPARARVAVVAAALHAYQRAGRPLLAAPATSVPPWALSARPRVRPLPR